MKNTHTTFRLKFLPVVGSFFVILFLVFFASRMALARDGERDSRNNSHSENRNNETENENEVENETETHDSTVTANASHKDTSAENETEDNDAHNNEAENETTDNGSHEKSGKKDNETPSSSHGNSCEAHASAINRIMTRAVLRGERIVEVFTNITNRTEAFYVSKGNTLSTYDVLVADVTSKKTNAQNVLMTLQNVGPLDCSAADPKALLKSFRATLKQEIAALKEYKTAVQKLVQGVASVQPDDASENEDATNDATNASNEDNNTTVTKTSNETR